MTHRQLPNFIFSTLRTMACFLAAIVFLSAAPRNCRAALANIWHVPDNTTDLGFNMRDPEFEISTNTTVTVYEGLQKYNNSYGTANQTGGSVFFKGLSQAGWSSTTLQFYTNGGPSPNNQYWQASFNSADFGSNEVIEYYIYATFDGVNGVQNTYLYGQDAGGTATGSQAAAMAAPFTIRNRAAWLYHGNNRVVTAGSNPNTANVSFWLKIGYLAKDDDPASAWVNNACLYFTTDGSLPSGALGHPNNTTQVARLAYDHPETDPSIAGDAMWWVCTVSNLPDYMPINYVLGVWNSANNEEKFADYKAGVDDMIFSFSDGTNGDPVLSVNGVNADYTTTHVFVDEVAGTSMPLTIIFSPNQSNLTEVDVYSNLNRRNRATNDANGDGIPDGILPPDGNSIVAGDDSNYYKAYVMSPTSTPGQYSLTLMASNTGAYRLTARYQVAGNTNWFWYTSNGRRDHAVVVSPVKARNLILYELNAMIMDSQGTLENQRSTFTDMYNGPGSYPYDPVTNRFNLAYAQNLGVNWLWFQPIHPIGIDGRQTNPATGLPYNVGSPYSIKNFFQVNPLLSKVNTREGAMNEFTNFVAAADAAGINVMLDEPFNHTAFDCELDNRGVYYFAPTAEPTNEIRDWEARLFSLTNDYCERAYNAASIALAPDRGDFGKWTDVHDLYYGNYAALVCQNPQDNGNYLDEGDWFDYTTTTGNFDSITRNVWQYFSDCVLYWLDQTGCPAGTPANQTYKGIDGLRADFGQGLPPQCWEYIINKVRSRKWDFVFMAESLDGGAVTYRSNRHFDILNENIIFDLQSAASASDYRNLFDARRNAYGQSVILLNNTSHDEEDYADPYEALIRYAACSAIDGAPMIFYGEELGISTTFGFDQYQLNDGKTIPQFLDYNSLQPIFAPANRNYGLDQLWPVYAAINQARSLSAALRSPNRYYLDQTGEGGIQPNLFAVGKYEQANGSPNFYDVVFAFVNLDRNDAQQGNFNVNINQNGSNLFGILSNRWYNLKNIAAYTALDPNRRNFFLIPGNVSGTNLLNNGLYAALNPVPTSNSAWSNAPYEAQYLKLYDVTPPPQASVPYTSKAYVLGNVVTFSWTPSSDPIGGVSGYQVIVGTAPGASNVFCASVTGMTLTVTNAVGATLYAEVSAVNNAGIQGQFSGSSSGTVLLDPNSLLLSATPATGAKVTLSWPSVLNTNFTTLLSASNAGAGAAWYPVRLGAVLQGQQWQVTVPAASPAAAFYRLELQ